MSMQLLPVHDNQQSTYIASAVRNVCNATLSLIFTIFLFVWGLFVKRHQAWRSDGGTVAFGVSALSLALVSTALTFLYVPREEEYFWLPGLVLAVVLWQTFLGWWWWVGSGSGPIHGLDRHYDMLKGKRKTDSIERKKKNTPKANTASSIVTGTSGRQRTQEGRSEKVERLCPQSYDGDPSSRMLPSPVSSVSSITTPGIIPRILPVSFQRWYHQLRQAHRRAARAQDVERVTKIRGLERDSGHMSWFLASPPKGLGNFEQGMAAEMARDPSIDRQHQQEWQDLAGHDHELKEGSATREQRVINERNPVERDVATPQLWRALQRWRRQDSTIY
jgi:hypothetical protein